MDVKNTTVAVFIDAENVSATNADEIFLRASDYGDVIIKKIFGDWSNRQVGKWKPYIEKHSIVAEQQFSFVKGKNSSDISLIIQAMLAMFERNIDVYCLVSSDSDFTRLVQELRERQKKVVGMGTMQAPKSFVNAFSDFIYLGTADKTQNETKQSTLSAVGNNAVANNNNNGNSISNSVGVKTEKPQKQFNNSGIMDDDKVKSLLEIVETLVEENGKAYYAQISNDMKNKYSDFIPVNYGCRTFKELIAKLTPELSAYSVGHDGVVMYLYKK